MKTTLDLNDELLKDAERQAAASGATLTAFVEEALRVRMRQRLELRKRFRLDLPIVEGKRPPAVDVADRTALYDFLEKRS